MQLDLESVRASIAGTQFAAQVQHYSSVSSTNTLALEAAQNGARSGVWVADEQTAGRGRGGHQWHSSPDDGLYVSALVAPELPANDALRLSLSTALAVRSAIERTTNLTVDIRWPNDLLIHRKKCGGILVETAVSPSQRNKPASLKYAVIGIGINLNHESFPLDLAALATSLRIACGHTISREQLLASLLCDLDEEVLRLARDSHRTSDLLERFTEASTWVRGKRVRVDEMGGYTGVTAGLDEQGFLKVDSDDGVKRTVLSGGVREIE
ncbi:MAG: biotin--[acetyl-CoA-carboxylase] ligase [Acidobacteria bacterium]|nr:biotin--[acetyl-CoA-carboxylase] ligase [Acidobacteriota bacterium]